MMPRNTSGVNLKLPASFFIFGLIMLATMAVTAPWGIPHFSGPFSLPELLAFLHLFTLGFTGSIIMGASYQLVPVVLESRLAAQPLAWLSLAAYLPGVVIFIISLSQSWLPGIAVGASLAGFGILLYTACVLATVALSQKRTVFGWLLASGASFACLGMIAGVMLAVNKSNGFLAADTVRWLGAHIVLMLAGWVGITYTTVAAKLIAMFTLTEQRLSHTQIAVIGSLIIAGAIVLSAALLGSWIPLQAELGAALLTAGGGLFLYQIYDLYTHRLRRAVDVHMPFAVLSAIWMVAAMGGTLLGIVLNRVPGDLWWPVVVWITLWGAWGTAIMGFLIKIASMLVWLHRYAPIAGRKTTPKLNEMYNAEVAWIALGSWTAGTMLAAMGVHTSWIPVYVPAIAIAFGVGLIAFTLVTIFRHLFAGPKATPQAGSTWQAPHRASR